MLRTCFPLMCVAYTDLNSTSQQRRASMLLRRRLIDVTLTLRICCPPTYFAFRPKFDVLTTSNLLRRRWINVTSMLRVCCPPMCVAYRPTLDVQMTSNFDVGTTGVDRRCVYVVRRRDFISTYFQRRNDVGVPAGNLPSPTCFGGQPPISHLL